MNLSIGQISDSVGFFSLFVAEEKGYFEEEGITLGERPRLGTGAKLSAALTSGSVDIAAGVSTDALTLAEAGRSAQIIGSLINSYYLDITVSDELASSIDTEGASLEERVQALEGKKIGITGLGSGTEALVVYLFETAGLDAQRDATLVNLGADFAAVFSALESGQVDALSFFWPVPQAAETQGLGETLISPAAGDVPGMEDQTHGVAFTTEEVINAKPEAVEAFIRAIARAEDLIKNEPEEAKQLLGDYQSTLDEETLDAEFEDLQPSVPDSPEITEEQFDQIIEFHETAGLLDQDFSYNDLVNSSIIEEALSEG
jgi:NitT/TauT family transport system substrate-binding protein